MCIAIVDNAVLYTVLLRADSCNASVEMLLCATLTCACKAAIVAVMLVTCVASAAVCCDAAVEV